ncbi:MAG: CDP-2,3-bis-(O-geranylgeranyl)-sn-glycerol synthase [Candidatus Diapherotrites archaeon]|nr:CDP-2,3-bis-(O-geranylgeranyl)-sn-glycerol synthase [Candidatus Diapherotrites archaeon]
MAVTELLLKLIVLLAPMYVANSTAMLFGGKYRLDFGKKFFDGRPVFGPGKTFSGAFAGIILGSAATIIVYYFLTEHALSISQNYMFFGFLVSIGSIAGDTVASFFKRRSNISPGTPVLFLDQLDFVIGGLIFGSLIFVPTFYETIIIAVATLIIHKLSNFIAFKAKLKKVPW